VFWAPFFSSLDGGGQIRNEKKLSPRQLLFSSSPKAAEANSDKLGGAHFVWFFSSCFRGFEVITLSTHVGFNC